MTPPYRFFVFGGLTIKIIEYHTQSERDRSHWEELIARADWRAAQYLSDLLAQNKFQESYGPDARLLLLTDSETLAGFCTMSRRDEIDDDTLFPWIGFLYIFPQYRGHRFSQMLIDHACIIAKRQGHSHIYISSDEHGLYEKYGFSFLENRETIWGDVTQVFVREL